MTDFDTAQLTTKLGVGTVFGACAAVALKRMTRDAAYGVGLGVIVLQALSYYGYITINWTKVNEDITKAADQNGDGKLDYTDAKLLVNRIIRFLARGVPDAAGFTAGFYAGVRLL